VKKDQTNSKDHYIPQFYLRGFANDSSKLSIWKRKDGQIRISNIDNSVAAIGGYYTAEESDGSRTDIFEKSYAQIEASVVPIVKNISSIFPYIPSGEDKKALSNYIAAQFVRIPIHRKQFEMTFDAVNKISARESLIYRASETKGPLNEEQYKFVKNPHMVKIKPKKSLSVALEFENIPVIARYLFCRRWDIIAYNKPAIITSDNPVLLVPNAKDANLPVGIATAEKIIFPLSATRMLVMSLPDSDYLRMPTVIWDAHYSQFCNEFVYSHNWEQANGSYREAYGNEKSMAFFKGKKLGNRSIIQIGFGNNDYLSKYSLPTNEMPYRK
jgi:hypothetical protein